MFLFLLFFCIFRVFNTYRFPGEEGDRQEVTDGREGRDEEVVVVIRRSRVIGRAGVLVRLLVRKKPLFCLNSCSPWWSRRTLSGLGRKRCWPSWSTSRLTKDKNLSNFPEKNWIFFLVCNVRISTYPCSRWRRGCRCWRGWPETGEKQCRKVKQKGKHKILLASSDGPATGKYLRKVLNYGQKTKNSHKNDFLKDSIASSATLRALERCLFVLCLDERSQNWTDQDRSQVVFRINSLM